MLMRERCFGTSAGMAGMGGGGVSGGGACGGGWSDASFDVVGSEGGRDDGSGGGDGGRSDGGSGGGGGSEGGLSLGGAANENEIGARALGSLSPRGAVGGGRPGSLVLVGVADGLEESKGDR